MTSDEDTLKNFIKGYCGLMTPFHKRRIDIIIQIRPGIMAIKEFIVISFLLYFVSLENPFVSLKSLTIKIGTKTCWKIDIPNQNFNASEIPYLIMTPGNKSKFNTKNVIPIQTTGVDLTAQWLTSFSNFGFSWIIDIIANDDQTKQKMLDQIVKYEKNCTLFILTIFKLNLIVVSWSNTRLT